MADHERVVIVDENNQVIGNKTRKEMRERGLIHRATYIFVLSRDKELYVQKRTASKDMYPSYLDLAAGGVVQHDESYELSAEREAEEELGIVDTPLVAHPDFFYRGDGNEVWGRIFTCTHDGPFQHQPEEVEDGWFTPIEQALTGLHDPVTPDSLMALQLLRKDGIV